NPRSRCLLATNDAKMAATIIEEQLWKCGYKRDSDVSELYLGRKGLKEIPDLSKFRMLKYLWLNHNKIPRITCLVNNFRLSELYLNNNELCDITGSLKHLTSLCTLLLNNNQLAKLQATVNELKGMTNLQTLNLFHNPLAQESGYRLYVIHHIPAVQLLDRERVTQKEREDAFKLFNPERTAVIQSLGFGRRTCSVLGTKKPSAQGSVGYRSVRSSGNQVYNLNRRHMDVLEDAFLLRAYHRSVMQYSLLDWSKMESPKQRRTEEHPVEPAPLITITFR
ncbi:leucine-rich repeat-containing protein 72, partial [Rhinophrynus dorsalis]